VTRLLLIRHAEPDEDARGRCYGRLDIGLSRGGLANAERLARSMSTIELAAVYTSPRTRALQTATALCASPIVDERLREIDFGELEGRTYEEIERERPELYRRWMETPTLVRFPGGENYTELRSRVAACVGEVVSSHAGAVVAVVAHGGVVRTALADALGLPNERAFALDVGYGRVSVVDWFGSTPVVRLVNGTTVDVPRELGT
jgi:alpha-ribazole phosphatase/probable phosphoglycerate mutase